jgi:hypothetical protein
MYIAAGARCITSFFRGRLFCIIAQNQARFQGKGWESGQRQSGLSGTQMRHMKQIAADFVWLCGNLRPICGNLRSLFDFDVAWLVKNSPTIWHLETDGE